MSVDWSKKDPDQEHNSNSLSLVSTQIQALFFLLGIPSDTGEPLLKYSFPSHARQPVSSENLVNHQIALVIFTRFPS